MNTHAHEIVLLATAISALTDARTGKIPNWLVFVLIPLGIGLNFWALGVQGLLISGLGLAMCALVPALLWLTSGGTAIGGGDLKLFAAIGALVGPNTGLEIQLTSYIALLVVALFLLTWKGLLWRTLVNAFWMMVNWMLPRTKRREIAQEAMMAMRLGPSIFIASGAIYLLNFSGGRIFGQ